MSFGCWGWFFFFNFLFKIYVISSLFVFQARRHLGVSPAFPFGLAGKKANLGAPSPCAAVRAHLSPPAEGQLSCPGCRQGDSGLQDRPDRGRGREKGNYMLGFADKMNLLAVPEPLKRSQCLVLPRQGLDTRLRLTPELSDPSLPAPAAVGVSSCESQGLLWLQTKENLFQRQEIIPQAQLLKDGCLKAADFSAYSFFSSFFKHW